MSTPKSEEDGVLREWAPLSKLLGQIPLTIRKGLFFEDVKFTCTDAASDSIVIGTNVGLIFWYDRNDHSVEKLSPEKGGCPITAVKVVSTVDFMVAAGDTNGVVSIFKIPKLLPSWLLSDVSVPQERKIERFTVGNLHISHITTLEWSMNGQKLFSGDSSGRVIFTEIDFFLNLTKAREILNENFSIVQLSYNQHLAALVVATIHRCIICYKDSSNWRILQIGQKERSCLAELGGVFFNNEIGTEPIVLSCRPGLRLWQADINGNVQKTIIFKDAMKACTSEVPLLNNASSSGSFSNEFGRIHTMSDGCIVSQSRSDLLVMNIGSVTVKAKLSFPRLISACTTSSEIFIIPSDRDLLRLSFTPDIHNSSLSREGNMATAESVSSLPSFNILPITGTLLENISDTRPLSMPCEVMYGQDSAILPPIVPIQEGVAELRLENIQRHVFPSIGHQQFDDIIYRNNKRPNKNKRWRRSYEEQKSNSPIGKLWNSLSGPDDVPFRNSAEETLVELAMEVPSDFLSDTTNLDRIIQDAKRQSQIDEDSAALKSGETSEKLENASISTDLQQNMGCQSDNETNNIESHELLLNSNDLVDGFNEELLNDTEIFNGTGCEESRYFVAVTNENQIVPQSDHFAERPSNTISNGQFPTSPSLHSNMDDLKTEFMLHTESKSNLNIKTDPNENETFEEVNADQSKTILIGESPISETVCESLLEAFDNPDTVYLLKNNVKTAEMSDGQIIFNPNAQTSSHPVMDSYFDSTENINSIEFPQYESKETNSSLICDDVNNSPSLESVENDKNSVAETNLTESISIDRSPLFSRISECEEFNDYYVIRREMSEETKKKIHPWITSLIDIGDGWKELQCPGRCISVSGNDDEVVICTPELIAYRLIYDEWEKLVSCAEQIDLSPSGRLVATVNCGVAHYSNLLSGSEWTLLGREVEHVSVDDKGIWYISRSELFFLPAGMRTAKKVNTNPYKLVKIYSHNETIAGVTDEGEVVKFIGEFNKNWQLVMTSEIVNDLSFGPGKLAWFLDKNNNLFVSDNFTLPSDSTKWWQVVIGNSFMVDIGAIYSSEDCLYVCDSVKPLMYVNRSIVKGHQWALSDFDLNCCQISVEGLLEDNGAIWILTKSNKLFYGTEQPPSIREVPTPWKIVCMSCTPHALWLLSEEGSVHMRQGISTLNPMGTHWSDLNLEQIYDKNMQLVHISCGWDVIWACDIRGHVLMTVSSPHNITDDDMFSPAWVPVDGSPLHNNTFTKVYVGADSRMVWALDSAGNLYVRKGIYPDFIVGTDWEHVPGIKASHLCICLGVVWALSNECIYKRMGISQRKCAGESWVLIPGLFDNISVSGINQLWGINSSNGSIMKHLEKMFVLYHEPYSDSSSEWTFV